jgi:outer membrane immunogenic protein
MSGTFRPIVFLLGALSSLSGLAQQTPVKSSPAMIDVAFTYVAERAKIASSPCGCFWLQGGSMNMAVTVYRGLGVAVNLTGEQASNVQPGVDLDKVSFMVGPRYTFTRKSWFGHDLGEHGAFRIFGEGLAGGVHAFNTVIPSSTGVAGAADSVTFQVGGGVDRTLRNHIGIRLIEADYVYSSLPNAANNTQHDLRLAAGISFRFSNWEK